MAQLASPTPKGIGPPSAGAAPPPTAEPGIGGSAAPSMVADGVGARPSASGERTTASTDERRMRRSCTCRWRATSDGADAGTTWAEPGAAGRGRGDSGGGGEARLALERLAPLDLLHQISAHAQDEPAALAHLKIRVIGYA